MPNGCQDECATETSELFEGGEIQRPIETNSSTILQDAAAAAGVSTDRQGVVHMAELSSGGAAGEEGSTKTKSSGEDCNRVLQALWDGRGLHSAFDHDILENGSATAPEKAMLLKVGWGVEIA